MNPTCPRSHRWLLCLLATVGIAADQTSKYQVFPWLRRGGEYQGQYVSPSGEMVRSYNHAIFDGGFELLAQFSNQPERPAGGEAPKVNKGALFGMGGEYGNLANAVFAIVSVLAGAAILYWSTRPPTARDVFLCAALGLILAGTMGNLYDRVVFGGVRDFLHYFYLFEWPVFNLADCCLVTGAGLLLGQAFLSRPAACQAASPAQPASEMAKAG